MKTKLLLSFLALGLFASAQPISGLVARYTFNNTYGMTGNAAPFQSNAGTSFTTGRDGVANGALNINGTGTYATISGLPYGVNTPRTISLWVKFNALATFNYLYSYGTTSNYNAVNVDSNNISHYGAGGSHVEGQSSVVNIWYNFVIVYDGTNSKIYKNGLLIGSLARNWTVNNNSDIFRLGRNEIGGNYLNAAIDDLNIYNKALNPTEIQWLYDGIAPPAIAVYNFDNTYNNIDGTNPFSNATNNFFVTDRNGNLSSALYVNDSYVTAAIPNLPYGNLVPASVSIWVKLINGGGYVYSYGLFPNSGSGFLDQNTTIAIGPGGNNSITSTSFLNVWYHLVFVYDGQASRIYKNGVLISALDRNWNIINNSNFFNLGINPSTGQSYFNGYVDDLKIYNYALPQTEVTNLYNNNSLSTQNFNQNNLEVSLYPNPANDVLNIDMTNEVKSVEIYNIQGQKVMSANQKQINVSDLSSGLYLVKIQDSENAIATKKIIIK